MTTNVAEVVSFKLKPDVDETAFLESSRPVDAFCRAQSGFVSRRLMRDESGEWIDYIEWVNAGAASQAAKLMPKAEGVGPFLAAIDMTTLSMRHLSIRHQL
jgi:hypothetical protein